MKWGLLFVAASALCVISTPVRADTIVYKLTQDLPRLGTDSPTSTWTTGPLSGYVPDGTPLPFVFPATLNADAIADGYTYANTPDVAFSIVYGSFEEFAMDYFFSGFLFIDTNTPICPVGSDQSGCTFTTAVSYQNSAQIHSGFGLDVLDITPNGAGTTPEPNSAFPALLGGLGILAICRPFASPR
jgi:hypothetical protein